MFTRGQLKKKDKHLEDWIAEYNKVMDEIERIRQLSKLYTFIP